MARKKLRVKAILLDLDGTIVDSREAYVEALKSAFATVGQKLVSEKAALEIPRRLEQNLPIDGLIGDADTQRFLEVYLKAYYEATTAKTKPMPKISETLDKLSKKAKLALITMRHVSREKIISELEKFGLSKYFQHIVTALDTRDPKPSPEALMRCAEELCVEPRECMVVGDSVADIRAGKRAGAKTVAVLSGIFSLKELEAEKPDLIIESVAKLPDFIE
ncbi:MAG: HAD family hydrolase [Candidatus Bathyarchaeales archaeon]